ncbi:MAG TPA: collagen-like protein [Thermoleophilaceae bacterium]|nr:collagen-like protein [Thermoleophilaceae bacterium]
MRKRIKQPSPALVVACIALFVALGGVGYAAATIGTKDIRNGAVTGKKIKNRTITTNDIKRKTVASLRGKTGPAGATGPAGPTGPAGATGATGARGPSDGFFFRGTNILNFVTNTDQTVATMALPAGSFILTAKVVVNNNEGAVRQYGCSLELGGTVIDNFHDALELDVTGSGAADDRDVVALTSGGTLAAPGNATVVCRTNSASGNWLARTITAVQVATLNGN